MEPLTQQIINLSPLALVIIILVAMSIGWIIYGLRGYKHWFKRFHRYGTIPSRRQMRRGHGYVEYIPALMQQPRISRPQLARAPQIINKEPSAVRKPAPSNIPVATTQNFYSTKDDLQVIEGIGPKVETLLNSNGIHTWRELAQTPIQNVKTMLERAGFTLQDPTTWSKQAHMADSADWDGLRSYQDALHGGR